MGFVCHLLCVLFLFSSAGHSQINITVNMGVDTLDQKARIALLFYSNYIAEFNSRTSVDYCKYWPKPECNIEKGPDLFNYKFGNNQGRVPIYNCGSPTVIYVKCTNDTVQIKTHIGAYDSTGIYTTAITNHYVDITNPEQPQFIIPLLYNAQSWNKRKVRNVTYYYPPYHKFNETKADSLISQIQRLEKDWNLEPIEVDYYLTYTGDEFEMLIGFDYVAGMGNNSLPEGRAEFYWRPTIICAGLGENYFHEIVHIYLGPLNPKSILGEGFAVFYGGSRGFSPEFHAERLRKYLEENPEADFSDLRSYSFMDFTTNPDYVNAWLICRDIYRKEGIDGLKRVLRYTAQEELMKVEYGVERDRWNEVFLRLLFE